MKNLNGQVALVTGAASGIGRATALELAKHGVDLVLADIDEARLAETGRMVAGTGRKVLCVGADVALKDDLGRLASRAIAGMGRVDLLLNNAGVGFFGRACTVSEADWERIVDINLWAPIRLTRALLPHMIERGSGHVVSVASMAGILGVSLFAPYSVTKFGVVGFSEALRGEVAPDGVDVSVVCPGQIETGIAGATLARQTGRVDGEAMAKRLAPRWYPAYPVEKAARDIVRGIRQRRPYILVGYEARLFWWFKRAFPSQMDLFNRVWIRVFESRLAAAESASPVPHDRPYVAAPPVMCENDSSTARPRQAGV